MERFNMSMRKYLKEVGVTSQEAIERVVREEKLDAQNTELKSLLQSGLKLFQSHLDHADVSRP